VENSEKFTSARGGAKRRGGHPPLLLIATKDESYNIHNVAHCQSTAYIPIA